MKRGRINLNRTGYTKGTETAKNPYNIIPSDTISMRNVDHNIYAIPVDINGKPGERTLLKPGEVKKFDGAKYVIEIPEESIQNAQAGVNNLPFSLNDYAAQTGSQPDYSWMNNPPQTSIYGYDEGGNPVSMPNPGVLTPQQEQANQEISSQFTTEPSFSLRERQKSAISDDLQMQGAEISLSKQSEQGAVYLPPQPTTPTIQGDNTLTDLSDSSIYDKKIKDGEPYTPPNTDKIQFFNPYGGVDIPTAAGLLGENIEQGDALGIVTTGLKTLTGLGRNVMGGIGRQRRNQYIINKQKEDQAKADKDAMTTNLQAGGQFLEEDYQNIKNSTGINFTKEYIDENFYKTGTTNRNSIPKVEMGRYEGRDYFKVVGREGDSIVITNTEKNPHNAHTIKELEKEIKKMNPNQPVSVRYTPKGQDGGIYWGERGFINLDKQDSIQKQQQPLPNIEELDINKVSSEELDLFSQILQEEYDKLNPKTKPKFQAGGQKEVERKILTGDYTTDDNAVIPNTEIEAGEYRKAPGAAPTEVIGEKHSNGGVDVELEDGEQVLSDHTKVGTETAKKLKDELDIKINAKDTYAKILDKYKVKIGLEKLLKEEEEILKKLESVKEKTKGGADQTTMELNHQMLQNKLNEIEQEKQPLRQKMTQAFDKLFELQENKKPVENKKELKFGGEFKKLAEKYNIPEDKAIELFEKYMQEGGQRPFRGLAIENPPTGQSENEGFYGNVTQEQFEILKQRAPWFEWEGFDPTDPEDVLRFQKEYNSRVTEGAKIKEDGLFGEQTITAVLEPILETPLNTSLQRQGHVVTPTANLNINIPKAGTIADPVNEEDEEDESARTYIPLLPDQTPLPPSSMQAHLLGKRRYGRLDPEQIRVEQQLQEIQRQSAAALESASSLPDSQRRAAEASIMANTQAAVSKVTADAERTNAAMRQQAQQFNIQQADKEQDAALEDALSYERRQLTAQAKTEDDIRRFYNHLNKINLTNFNTVQNMNLLNQMYDNFNFDGSGGVVPVGDQTTFGQDIENRLKALEGQAKKGGTYKKKRGRKKK